MPLLTICAVQHKCASSVLWKPTSFVIKLFFCPQFKTTFKLKETWQLNKPCKCAVSQKLDNITYTYSHQSLTSASIKKSPASHFGPVRVRILMRGGITKKIGTRGSKNLPYYEMPKDFLYSGHWYLKVWPYKEIKQLNSIIPLLLSFLYSLITLSCFITF